MLGLLDALVGQQQGGQGGVGVEDARLQGRVKQAPLVQAAQAVGGRQGCALKLVVVFEGEAVVSEDTRADLRAVDMLKDGVGVLLPARGIGLGKAAQGSAAEHQEQEKFFHREKS